jgi:hypothetical protein
MKKILLHTIFLVAAIVVAVAQDTVVPQTYEFVKRGDKPLLMDVYTPVTPRQDSACVVFMF